MVFKTFDSNECFPKLFRYESQSLLINKKNLLEPNRLPNSAKNRKLGRGRSSEELFEVEIEAGPKTILELSERELVRDRSLEINKKIFSTLLIFFCLMKSHWS